MSDPINPDHYKDPSKGVQCIDVTEHLSFSLGNAVKYLWRAGKKNDFEEDIKKAEWYFAREVARLREIERRKAKAAEVVPAKGKWCSNCKHEKSSKFRGHCSGCGWNNGEPTKWEPALA